MGSGGASLLSNLEGHQYRRSGQAGVLRSRYGVTSKAHGAQFAITTRTCDWGADYADVFGQVEQGLEVLQEAANYGNAAKVMIVDCGVVLTSL